jgi:branched-chain amino acid transport system ATP-binding protein
LGTDAPKTGPILELDGVVTGYGGTSILDGVNFAVQRAAITTIIGANGAGKSTVFKTIFGLLPARHGKVRFDGRDVTNAAPRRLLELGMCYIPQGRNVFPDLSVRHNLELGGAAAKSPGDLDQRIDAALDRFPVLREKADRQASTLSSGEQKQVEIARGLLFEPKLVLIDEPSIGLSPPLVQAIFTVLTELRGKGVTVLMIEQNAKSALGLSDYAIVLELGRTRHQDRAAAVLADPRIGQLFLGGAMGSTSPPPSTLSWMQQ